jgi:hypothetical protein
MILYMIFIGLYRWFGLVYGVQRHFQQYFSYIIEVSFIGGGKVRENINFDDHDNLIMV